MAVHIITSFREMFAVQNIPARHDEFDKSFLEEHLEERSKELKPDLQGGENATLALLSNNINNSLVP